MINGPEVPRFEGDLEEVWDNYCAPSSAEDLLGAAVLYPGIDPYSVVSGFVRGVAVDRWCNSLLQRGLIGGWEDDSTGDIWIWATEKGKKYFKAIERLEDD